MTPSELASTGKWRVNAHGATWVSSAYWGLKVNAGSGHAVMSDLLVEVNVRLPRDTSSAESELPREVARELRDESIALREQARLQAERARRNVPAARRLDLICGSCGYGVSVIRPPDRCPMPQRLGLRATSTSPGASVPE